MLLALVPTVIRGDGLATILTAVSIPPSTVAVIDPSKGTSSGGGNTDVRLGPGDVIALRFRYVPVPDNNGFIDGMQAYLTVYLPANTQVIGARILTEDSAAAVAIPPRFPGMSVESASGSSISQVYADTGLFLTDDSRLGRAPLDDFLQFANGLGVTEPIQASTISAIVGANGGDVRAHNSWDQAQVNMFGGGGVPTLGHGSPVAGDDTFYNLDSTNSTGPWKRLRYDGALIGYNAPGGEILHRAVLDASALGYDLTPVNADSPPAAGARAVRFALGDVRLGRPGVAEVALRVDDTPLDSGAGTMNADVVCAEVFVGDDAKRGELTSGPGAEDNPWATFVPVPQCVRLNLLFDLRADRAFALAGDHVTWSLHGVNLSLDPQTNVVVNVGYDATQGNVANSQPPATAGACPSEPGWGGLTCRHWNLGTLAPSAAYTHTFDWSVGGGPATAHRLRAHYSSDQIAGYSTSDVVLVEAVPVLAFTASLGASSVAAGSWMPVSGTFENLGRGAATLLAYGVFVSSGWSVADINVEGGSIDCAGPFTTEASCPVSSALAANGGTRTLAFSVKPPDGTATGLYPVHVNVWMSAPVFGGEGENHFERVVMVPVGAARTPPPAITCTPVHPIAALDAAVAGVAPANATVRIYFDRLLRGTVVADGGGGWAYDSFPATFGPLRGGLDLRATAQSPGELESDFSAPCIVQGGAPDLAPFSLGVDDGGNQLLEMGETFSVEPAWSNEGAIAATGLSGSATSFSGPGGAAYTLVDDQAAYGEVGVGLHAGCADGADCYAVSIAPGSRPAQHWDTVLEELLTSGDAHSWTLHVGESFSDVAKSAPHYREVEIAYHHGIISGCGDGLACPADPLTREQLALLVLRAVGVTPGPCDELDPVFTDVPYDDPFCPAIEAAADPARQITLGCGGGRFCPKGPVRRGQAAMFVLRVQEAPGYTPPACVAGSEPYDDVAFDDPFCPWIQELKGRGLAVGVSYTCEGVSRYCPAQALSRDGTMAFLARAFGLRLYAP